MKTQSRWPGIFAFLVLAVLAGCGSGPGEENVPARPSNLVATTLSESSIALTWTDMSSDESGFVIERSTSTSGPWGRISVGPNVASFTDSGLSASTTYIYRLAAQNSDGISTYVGPVGAMTMVAGISLPTDRKSVV